MYCIKCGVELADSETVCPLCKTVVFHPELSRPEAPSPFPKGKPLVSETVSRSGFMFVITMLFALAVVLTLLCDWQINRRIVWAGYAAGAIVLLYITAILPLWFRSPNPVIFIPVSFAAAALFLLYICCATGGHWFLSFALPVTAAAGLILTAVAALLRYLRRGHLFVFGGAMLFAGGFTVLVEFLLNCAFHLHSGFIWSFYPMAVGTILGITLIVIGVCPPLKESLRKKFFL